MSIGTFLEENGEKVLLVVYFVVMIVVAGPLFLVLGEAWEASDVFRPLILSLNPLIGVNLEQFSSAMFGGYLGLLVLLTLDPKKRIQGLLLWLGTVSALIGLLSIGLFIPNIDFTANVLWILSGFVVGAIVGGGRQLLEVRTASALEFRRSATLLFYLISVVVAVGLIEYHVNLPQVIEVASNEVHVQAENPSVDVDWNGIGRNTLMAGVFVVTLRRFVTYDASESFFILGPPGSGKSLFLVGKYLEALDDAVGRDTDTPLNPSGDLMELVSALDAASKDTGWKLDSTGATDIEDLRFRFISGRVFPKNIELSSLDYAGEYLEELPTALMSADEEIDNSTVRLLAQRVRDANTLVLVIDVERFHNNEPLDIEPYFDILNAASNKDVLLVATKCDILAEGFRDKQALEAYQYFDEFKEFVNDTLIQNSQAVRTLVQDTSGSEIHPVYYQTTTNENGERVPMRNQNGNVQTVGFDELLQKMG
ncbi:P-loop NTPase family protein [Halorubrum vacuolatum]|uniref:Uncharacterized protein n=1 Tax=Halorubrum vacuolatum TaxID=63740 RepID=A0A238WQN8_HALVU|nr:hypothetical protein [Halorubrum vacuolatum]SNR48920.1 hypothetical protein SAMN06264855_10992 [Halorubrum vacuolatum]